METDYIKQMYPLRQRFIDIYIKQGMKAIYDRIVVSARKEITRGLKRPTERNFNVTRNYKITKKLVQYSKQERMLHIPFTSGLGIYVNSCGNLLH